MTTHFYPPLLSTKVKDLKSRCHFTSLCQGLRRSGLAGGSGGEDPEYQVGRGGGGVGVGAVVCI